MKARLLFEPRDIWVGIYIAKPSVGIAGRWQSIYICIVPMLPIRITWELTGEDKDV